MIRRAIRYVYRNLVPADLKGSLDLFAELRQDRLRILSGKDLKEKNVLALAPHPDDEVIGCGGTLRLYHENGARVAVVYMTDGRKGNPGYPEEELAAVREKEAAESSNLLGIDRMFFLRAKDKELSCAPGLVGRLSGILAEVRPEAVFLPFLLDNHPDHMATGDIFTSASRRYPARLACYGYEVWTPLVLPNRVVDISDRADLKRQAIEKHVSQTERTALADASFGLSRYRAVLHGAGLMHAEAFFHCDAREYRRLWRAASDCRRKNRYNDASRAMKS